MAAVYGKAKQNVWAAFKARGYRLRARVELPTILWMGRKYTLRNGYFYGTLKRDHSRPLHRDIWMHFNGAIPDGHYIHHINGVKTDNRIENLSPMKRSDHSRLHSTKPGLPVKNCAHCGERLFQKRYRGVWLESHIALSERNFCSIRCVGFWKRGRPRHWSVELEHRAGVEALEGRCLTRTT